MYFTTIYPYPHSQSTGAGNGTDNGGLGFAEGMLPFSTLPFYLDDLWYYNLTSQLWTEITPVSKTKPQARTDHKLVKAGEDMLFLMSGYITNYHYGDFWLYHYSKKRWIEKTEFLLPVFPDTCVDGGIVQGEPTRYHPTDGVDGRASEPVFISQTRRRGPGWDGCRNIETLVVYEDKVGIVENLYEQPSQRSDFSLTYSEKHGSILLYGGHGYDKVIPYDNNYTEITHIFGDFWIYNTCI